MAEDVGAALSSAVSLAAASELEAESPRVLEESDGSDDRSLSGASVEEAESLPPRVGPSVGRPLSAAVVDGGGNVVASVVSCLTRKPRTSGLDCPWQANRATDKRYKFKHLILQRSGLVLGALRARRP